MTLHNPQFSTYLKEDAHYESDDVHNLNEADFRIAFAIEGFAERDLKIDNRYIKYIFRLYGKLNNEPYEHILTYHECTDEDYDQFYPI